MMANSVQAMQEKQDIYIWKDENRFISLTLHKNQFRMDQRPSFCKAWNTSTAREKHFNVHKQVRAFWKELQEHRQ